jgi:hypothetical protein
LPGHRISGSRDSAGRVTAAERESIRGTYLARWAEAGLDPSLEWPHQLLSRYQELARLWHLAPIRAGFGHAKRALAVVTEMQGLEHAAEFGLREAGLALTLEDGTAMVPRSSGLFDLQRRAALCDVGPWDD